MIDGAWPPTIDQFLTDNVAFGIGYWCVFEGAAGDWLPFPAMERIIAATAVLGTFFIVYRLASWIVEIFPGKCS